MPVSEDRHNEKGFCGLKKEKKNKAFKLQCLSDTKQEGEVSIPEYRTIPLKYGRLGRARHRDEV